MIKQVSMIDCNDLDTLVTKTYGRLYCFQQQDGCLNRGSRLITVPCEFPEDFGATSIKEEVNGEEMGVSFTSWLERNPTQKLDTADEWAREHGLSLFWSRNFYPSLDMVVNDLFGKGLLPAGEYVINIDW